MTSQAASSFPISPSLCIWIKLNRTVSAEWLLLRGLTERDPRGSRRDVGDRRPLPVLSCLWTDSRVDIHSSSFRRQSARPKPRKLLHPAALRKAPASVQRARAPLTGPATQSRSTLSTNADRTATPETRRSSCRIKRASGRKPGGSHIPHTWRGNDLPSPQTVRQCPRSSGSN